MLHRCPSVALGIWAGLLQTGYSRGPASSPTQISLHTSSHITGTSVFPAKMTFPPGQQSPLQQCPWCPPGPTLLALPAGQVGADTEVMHVWCDRPTKMSCVWTSIPDSTEGLFGKGRFHEGVHPSVDARAEAWSWRTSSFCRAEDIQQNREVRRTCEGWVPQPDSIPLTFEYKEAKSPALPPLSWQTRAPLG